MAGVEEILKNSVTNYQSILLPLSTLAIRRRRYGTEFDLDRPATQNRYDYDIVVTECKIHHIPRNT
jgi:hypothetical protein